MPQPNMIAELPADKNITQIIVKVREQMCDSYCKYKYGLKFNEERKNMNNIEVVKKIMELGDNFHMCDVSKVSESGIHLESWNEDVSIEEFNQIAMLIARDDFDVDGLIFNRKVSREAFGFVGNGDYINAENEPRGIYIGLPKTKKRMEFTDMQKERRNNFNELAFGTLGTGRTYIIKSDVDKELITSGVQENDDECQITQMETRTKRR